MKINNIFSVPLYRDNFNIDCKKLIKEVLKEKKKNKGRMLSNFVGWQSDSFNKIKKPFEELFNLINLSVNNYQKVLQYTKNLKLCNYWFNVSPYGAFNRPHNHSPCCLSGVFYLSVPKNSGNIVFMNSNSGILDITFPNLEIYNQWTSSRYAHIPKQNDFLLFPSYAEHYVETNMNKKYRISMSFNYVV